MSKARQVELVSVLSAGTVEWVQFTWKYLHRAITAVANTVTMVRCQDQCAKISKLSWYGRMNIAVSWTCHGGIKRVECLPLWFWVLQNEKSYSDELHFDMVARFWECRISGKTHKQVAEQGWFEHRVLEPCVATAGCKLNILVELMLQCIVKADVACSATQKWRVVFGIMENLCMVVSYTYGEVATSNLKQVICIPTHRQYPQMLQQLDMSVVQTQQYNHMAYSQSHATTPQTKAFQEAVHSILQGTIPLQTTAPQTPSVADCTTSPSMCRWSYETLSLSARAILDRGISTSGISAHGTSTSGISARGTQSATPRPAKPQPAASQPAVPRPAAPRPAAPQPAALQLAAPQPAATQLVATHPATLQLAAFQATAPHHAVYLLLLGVRSAFKEDINGTA